MEINMVEIAPETYSYWNQTCGSAYWSEMKAVEAAEEHEWTGFALMMGNSVPVPWQDASDNAWGHFCQFAIEKTNYEVITRELGEVTKDGVEFYEGCVEFEGNIAYDHGNEKIRELVEDFERALSNYGILDEMRMSELEYENALGTLESCYNIPDDIDASDVLSALSDKGESDCPDCSSWDVEEVLEEMGWRECAGSVCNDMIKTTTEGAVCHECAVFESVNPECDHAFLLVDMAKHNGRFITEKEMHEADQACEDCYRELYPYGRD